MSKNYFIGVDMGTTGVRTVIFDEKGAEVGSSYLESPLVYPKLGWAECPTQVLVDNARQTSHDAIVKSGIDPKDIVAMSFSYARVGMVTRDADGEFNRENTIMWFDARAVELGSRDVAKLDKAGWTQEKMYNTRGFMAGGAGPIAKVRWLQENEPETFKSTAKIHNWHSLLLKAYGVNEAIDPRGDSGWFGFTNIETMDWDDEIIKVLECEDIKHMLPELKFTTELAGHVSKEAAEITLIPEGTPIYVGNGDHQCGALGLGVIEDDQVYMCIGTTGTISRVAYKPIRHPELTCSVLGSNLRGWQMDANSPTACGCLKWFKNTFCQDLIKEAEETGQDVYDLMTAEAAKANPGADGTVFLPWPTGASGCPHYDPNPRMTFVGMTNGHTRAEMIRAVMEGVCYENRDLLENLDKAGAPAYESLRFTGGGARSALWCQMHADILGKPIETVSANEAVACGAAIGAAIGSGYYKSAKEAVENMVHVTGRYEPNPANKELYDKMFGIYKGVYEDMKSNTFPAINNYQVNLTK